MSKVFIITTSDYDEHSNELVFPTLELAEQAIAKLGKDWFRRSADIEEFEVLDAVPTVVKVHLRFWEDGVGVVERGTRDELSCRTSACTVTESANGVWAFGTDEDAVDEAFAGATDGRRGPTPGFHLYWNSRNRSLKVSNTTFTDRDVRGMVDGVEVRRVVSGAHAYGTDLGATKARLRKELASAGFTDLGDGLETKEEQA